MKDLLVDAGEEIPPNPPKLRIKPVQVNFFVDSDYSGYILTWISQTRMILYCNSASIIWYSKSRIRLKVQLLGRNL